MSAEVEIPPRGLLLVSAVQSITVDATAMSSLTAPSSISLNTIRMAAEGILQQPIEELKKELVSQVSALISDTAMSLGLEMMDVVPYFGTIIKAVAMLVSIIGGAKDAQDALLVQACNEYLERFKMPHGTGSALAGCVLCPTDIFARVYEPEPWRGSAGKKMRSALAQVLMRLTEGSPIDAYDLDWAALAAEQNSAAKTDPNVPRTTPRAMHDAWVKEREDAYQAVVTTYKTQQMDIKVGIPKGRRDQITAIRRAIESMYGPTLPAGAVSDGGVTLWPVYLDLFLDCFKHGWLNWDFCTYLIRYDVVGSASHRRISETGWFGPGGSPECTARIVGLARDLETQWKQSVQPYYVQGQAKMRELEEQASKEVGMRISTMPRSKLPVGLQHTRHPRFQLHIAPLQTVVKARRKTLKLRPPADGGRRFAPLLLGGGLVVLTTGLIGIAVSRRSKTS
jgi:hypothetical protein